MSKNIRIEEIAEFEQDILREHGSTLTKMYFRPPGSDAYQVAVMAFENDREKEIQKKNGRTIVEMFDIDTYFFTTESWLKTVKDNRPLVRPSRCVDRKEALVVSEYRKDRKNVSRLYLIERDGDTITFKDIGETNSMTSDWDFFLEEEGVRERKNKFYEEHHKKMVGVLHQEFVDTIGDPNAMEAEEVVKKTLKFIEDKKKELDKQLYEDVNNG